MNERIITIAIDGPVGAGKSTISDAVARRLNITHLDTGAMYRALGLAALRENIDLADERAVGDLCARHEVSAHCDGFNQRTLLDGDDVSDFIRTAECGMAASHVSKYAAVRRAMVARQREIASARSILMDGRDIGTVVLPDAKLKIFLTADPEERARRRYKDMLNKGEAATYEDVLAAVLRRDRQDETRAVDPLRRAPDAVTVDATQLTFEDTVETILRLAEERYGREAD